MTSLVAGLDSSTQSVKVLVCDASNGTVVREGSATHPDGTSIHPRHWWSALADAIASAGGIADVEAVSVGGQQHGMVVLDEDGEILHDALLWNDTRSAKAAEDLIFELGNGNSELGKAAWAKAIGSVPVASLTVTKLRWLADTKPEIAAKVAAVCLPHDWLTWKLSGAKGLESLATDRSEASGTGYFDPSTNQWRRDLLTLALRRDSSDIVLPRVPGPSDAVGQMATFDSTAPLGPGCGDNAGAALGLGLAPGDVSLSLGTSGVVAAVSSTPTNDATGLVTGFADATGAFLPMAVTLNASLIVDAGARVLGVSHEEFSELALKASPGAEGLVLVPYLEGERTPNLPDATGTMTGLTLGSMTRENFARATVEGMLGLMAGCLDAVRGQGVEVEHITLVGGGARLEAARVLAPGILGVPVHVPPAGEYVARGAARQAAWILAGGAEPPNWPITDLETYEASPTTHVLQAYRKAASRESHLKSHPLSLS